MSAKTKKPDEVETVVPVDPYEDLVEYTEYPRREEDEGRAFNISVNGNFYMINYGEPVIIPRFVAEALRNRKANVAYKLKNERVIKDKLKGIQ